MLSLLYFCIAYTAAYIVCWSSWYENSAGHFAFIPYNAASSYHLSPPLDNFKTTKEYFTTCCSSSAEFSLPVDPNECTTQQLTILGSTSSMWLSLVPPWFLRCLKWNCSERQRLFARIAACQNYVSARSRRNLSRRKTFMKLQVTHESAVPLL